MDIRAQYYAICEKIYNDKDLVWSKDEIRERLLRQLTRDMERRGLIMVSQPQFTYDPYHFSSSCMKDDCEFHHDLYYCSGFHPKFIKTIGPYKVFAQSVWALSREYAQYQSYFKEHPSFILRVEEV